MAKDEENGGKEGGGAAPKRVGISEAMRQAAGQLAELIGCRPSSVSSMKATEDGWTADVEVVEIEKVPDTTSVMASYHVSLGKQGELLGYERTHRYTRGQVDR